MTVAVESLELWFGSSLTMRASSDHSGGGEAQSTPGYNGWRSE